MLYFAYGSNMNTEQMAFRCPKAEVLGPKALKGYELRERTFADIERVKGGIVYGLLWNVTPECISALDRYEGVSNGHYYKKHIHTTWQGSSYRMLVYIMTKESAEPRNCYHFSDYYREACKKGAIENGVPVESLFQDDNSYAY